MFTVRKYCLLTVRSAQRLRYSADDFVGRVKCHLDKRVLIVVTFTIRTNVYLLLINLAMNANTE